MDPMATEVDQQELAQQLLAQTKEQGIEEGQRRGGCHKPQRVRMGAGVAAAQPDPCSGLLFQSTLDGAGRS